MSSFGRAVLCVLFFCDLSVSNPELPGRERTSVSCSQGLSQCTVKNKENDLAPENGKVHVRKLIPRLELRCQEDSPCWLCLVIDIELYIPPDTNLETTTSSTGSVKLCYGTPTALPTCKDVAFTIDHGGLQENLGKMSLLSVKPLGVSFGSDVYIYSLSHPPVKISAPLLKEECIRNPKRNIEECRAPRILTQISHDKNEVLLRLEEGSFGASSVCVQYEPTGKCQAWPHTTIPLPSVVPCLCLQAWNSSSRVRSLNCPFRATAFLFNNLWPNVTVSVIPGHMIDGGSALLWNLSAPCKLGGQVWPCERTTGRCREIPGFRQQLENRSWTQHTSGLWVIEGAFEDLHLRLSPCVMVTLVGDDEQHLGPFCFQHTNRWRWSLVSGGMILLLLLVGIHLYLFYACIKGYLWGCRHDGFARVGRRRHVVLISPPDVEADLSDSVCSLGSLLICHGFNVSVDLWCRKEQGRLGPLPWLHSQLLDLDMQGGQVVLILTHGALEKTREWTLQHKGSVSPKADLFTATLSLILAGRRKLFLLVSFESGPQARKLPELLRGIPLFQLPSQMSSLVAQLNGTKSERALCLLSKWQERANKKT